MRRTGTTDACPRATRWFSAMPGPPSRSPPRTVSRSPSRRSAGRSAVRANQPLIQGQGDVLIDQEGCRVWVKGRELDPPLSSAQFALLEFLIRTPGRVHSRDVLRAVAWPDQNPSGISDEAINSLVRRLRNRLTEIDPVHRYIYAVRGHGFKFQQPGASQG